MTRQAAKAIRLGRQIKQQRGQRTYDALIETAFKLLRERDFEEITIAQLALAAGYSVGAFYARFHSKDEFFDALIERHMRQRTAQRDRLLESLPDDTWIDDLFEDLVTHYWTRRGFWRAALSRSVRDPAFWEPLRKHGHEFADRIIRRISRQTGRALTAAEETNVRFALQIALGTMNNAIINRPGPVLIGQPAFVANLARAFRLVSDYDNLVGAAG